MLQPKENEMDSEAIRNMSEVRSSWTEDERRERRERAGAIQLQLKALVTLHALSEQREEIEAEPAAVASAC